MVERELLTRLRGVWGLANHITLLSNVFCLAAPAMQGFADDLIARSNMHAMNAHEIARVLCEHLPHDQAWCAQHAQHVCNVLPDGGDVQGEWYRIQGLELASHCGENDVGWVEG